MGKGRRRDVGLKTRHRAIRMDRFRTQNSASM
jgi:hypothetical protein